MIFYQIYGGYDRNFTYIVGDSKTKEVAVVDPSEDTIEVTNKINEENLKVIYIINTHSHIDHVMGNDDIKKISDAKVVMHEITEHDCDILVKDEDIINVGDVKIKIIYTPGHIPDHICLLINNKKLLTGDLLFVGKIGGTGPFFSGSDAKVEGDSLNKLMELNDDIEVWPGHDYGVMRNSTIKYEKEHNPFIKCKSFEELMDLRGNRLKYNKKHNIK